MIAQESIHRIAGALKAAAPVGSKIFLFGSHAKGTAREGSDLDLMVVEPKVDVFTRPSAPSACLWTFW
jgi:predicted nucleotidyltransferase